MHEIYIGLNGQERIVLVDKQGRVHHHDIDDLVDEWHKGDSDLPLHEYLGMTWDEYQAWV